MRKWTGFLAGFLVALLILLGGVAGAETISVSDDEGLHNAISAINAADSGEFIISLSDNIESTYGFSFTSNATKTILGNGHYIHYSNKHPDTYIFLMNGTLNLGDTTGNQLVIQGPGGESTWDSFSFIQVDANTTNGVGSDRPVLNMYEGVTICDCNVDNTHGGAIRLFTDERRNDIVSTFNMHGGTIKNCGPIMGSNQYGGAIGIQGNGVFNMYNGMITECYAQYGGAVCMVHTLGSLGVKNDPVFNMYGGSIISNRASYYGAGVAVFTGVFRMEGGVISNNTAVNRGGGLYIKGLESDTSRYALFISGGSITDNNAITFGGGIYSENADLNISSCSITGNHCDGAGGGIAALNGHVQLNEGSVLCNNDADSGSDYFGYAVAKTDLISAYGMNQNFRTTRFNIDGWYWDDENPDPTDPSYKWKYDEALKTSSTNEFKGDTIESDDSYLSLIAAFTAYDQIDITKTWDDNSDILGKRPESLTFTLTDASGNPVKLRAFDETTGSWTASGADAKITLTAADADSTGNVWTGTIAPLLVKKYSDTTSYLLKEEKTGDFYQLKAGDPSITFTADKLSDGTTDAASGKYKASFTNIGRIPVTIQKVWDGENDEDSPPTDDVHVELQMNGVRFNDLDGNETYYSLKSIDDWKKKVYLPVADYTNLVGNEDPVPSYTASTEIKSNEDGSYTITFTNKRNVVPIPDTSYVVTKVWKGTNLAGNKQLPRPEITVILYADGVEYARKVVQAGAADPVAVRFENVPKYNEGNELITYTIREEITDPDWVKVGENEWYSLDGMGKYTGHIESASENAAGNTENQTDEIRETAVNTYSVLQTTTTAEVVKHWADHQNENGIRLTYVKLGLFMPGTTDPVAIVILHGPENADAWNGSFTELPIYDENGHVIDYGTYTVMEAYPDTYYADGTPATWGAWIAEGGQANIEKDGMTYTYVYSVSMP